ncbi:hypothetical protein [Sinomonas albida]|uniref:hypothetical protein n=1 Tax=Sinomonas albida TaxID=369942 RepID=UPI00301AC3A5
MFLVVGDERQVKFHVRDPNDFGLLGFDWGKVQVVPDGTLAAAIRYDMGPFSPPGERTSDVFSLPLEPGTSIANGGNNCKDPSGMIRHNVLVAGWLSQDIEWNPTFGAGYEDINYGGVILDVEFLDRVYGPAGFSTLLNGAVLPGTPEGAPSVTLAQDGVGITANSFSMSAPFNQQLTATALAVHVELNAWHVNSHTSTSLRNVTDGFYRYSGRGPAPNGWISLPIDATNPGGYQYNPLVVGNFEDQWFQEDPRFPSNDPGGRPLSKGDYVLIWGTLFNDGPHGVDVWGPLYPGLGGYLEIHPWDWIGRAIPPTQRKAAYVASAVVLPDGTGQMAIDVQVGPPFTDAIPIRGVSDLKVLPDERFTKNPGAVKDATTTVPNGIHISVGTDPANKSFKTTYVATWRAQGAPLTLTTDPAVLTCDRPQTFTVRAKDPLGTEVHGVPIIQSGNLIGYTGEPTTETFRSIRQVAGTGVDGKHPLYEQVPPNVVLTVTPEDQSRSTATIQLDLQVPDTAA